MIITVTLNPAMDKTMVIDGIEIGEVNRADSIRNDIGGKGINVSKVLKSFGTDTLATGFLGGMIEEPFRKELNRMGIKDQFISIQGNTRTNIKLVDRKNETNTDINEPGPLISGGEIEKFIGFYKETVKKGDIVVLAGGLPPNISQDLYGRLTRMAKDKGALVVIDAEGEPLKHALVELPDMIKPNEKELASYLGKAVLTEEEIVQAARSLVEKGIQKVLVSRGEKGSIFATERSVFMGIGLEVEVKSTVGAGDSMVAALVFAEKEKLSDSETLALAQATGAAAVATEGTEACTREDVERYLADAREKIKEVR
ncbi:1-phosphofructokinase [Proteiniclasticum sp. SCR006]|uniref:Tagatose-6-phosphate kinase n=1 Tax=Proteiniclasticum aestuarii TaxID=2817862 RepID=A0A939KIX0_9CLOT|nr:1-phosphofructokinase [Proteiniclasticum aestuarii]MBO1264436.1 1-phosphofructokinase [Proteiniclasticum aestuarii]